MSCSATGGFEGFENAPITQQVQPTDPLGWTPTKSIYSHVMTPAPAPGCGVPNAQQTQCVYDAQGNLVCPPQ